MFYLLRCLKRHKEEERIQEKEEDIVSTESSNSDELNIDAVKSLFIKKKPSEVMEMLQNKIQKCKQIDKEETDSHKHAYNEGYLNALIEAIVLVNCIEED